MNLQATISEFRRNKIASWLSAINVAVVCIILGSTWVGFLRGFLPLLQDISRLAGMGTSWPVRFLITTHSWLLPLFFYCTAVVAIVKEGLLRDVRRKQVWNALMFLAVIVVFGFVSLALYVETKRLNAATQRSALVWSYATN